jgi:hypothetical protein
MTRRTSHTSTTEIFILSPGRGDSLVAIDDPTVILNWWQLSFLSAISGASTVKELPGGDWGIVKPASGPERGGVYEVPTPIIPHTNFWEDYNFAGDRLELVPGAAHGRLSQIHRGFLGSGNWNDIISSVQLNSDLPRRLV